MDRILLKKEVIDKISGDGELFGKVSNALGITPASLPRLLYRNHVKLTQAHVLKLLREHLNVSEDSELLTEMQPA
jgi:hypothetical protein